jgi:predicted DNA-binding transcriptional regulator AlpA
MYSVSLAQNQLLVFFRDGSVKKCDVELLVASDKAFSPIMKNENLFHSFSIQPGGYGVCWGGNLNIADETLYEHGIDVPLSLEDFRQFVECRVVNTAEAAELLGCSRQNIDDLIRRGKLHHPVKATSKNKFFLKSEIIQRNWK